MSTLLKTVCFSVLIAGIATAATAETHAKPAAKAVAAKPAKVTGQNAATRAAKEPLAGIATPVANDRSKIQCNSVVDCRRKGAELETVWQMNNGAPVTAAKEAAKPAKIAKGKKAKPAAK